MLVSIGEGKWRALRKLHLLGGEAEWTAVREWSRKGKEQHKADLIAAGLVEAVGDTRVRLTELGRTVQELGEMDLPLEALT